MQRCPHLPVGCTQLRELTPCHPRAFARGPPKSRARFPPLHCPFADRRVPRSHAEAVSRCPNPPSPLERAHPGKHRACSLVRARAASLFPGSFRSPAPWGTERGRLSKLAAHQTGLVSSQIPLVDKEKTRPPPSASPPPRHTPREPAPRRKQPLAEARDRNCSLPARVATISPAPYVASAFHHGRLCVA